MTLARDRQSDAGGVNGPLFLLNDLFLGLFWYALFPTVAPFIRRGSTRGKKGNDDQERQKDCKTFHIPSWMVWCI